MTTVKEFLIEYAKIDEKYLQSHIGHLVKEPHFYVQGWFENYYDWEESAIGSLRLSDELKGYFDPKKYPVFMAGFIGATLFVATNKNGCFRGDSNQFYEEFGNLDWLFGCWHFDDDISAIQSRISEEIWDNLNEEYQNRIYEKDSYSVWNLKPISITEEDLDDTEVEHLLDIANHVAIAGFIEGIEEDFNEIFFAGNRMVTVWKIIDEACEDFRINEHTNEIPDWIFDTLENEVMGTLLHWTHPKNQMVEPALIGPSVESSGQMSFLEV